uniref:Uncharacterized protein n=1 Tax=Salix viminalis TaxID=40686 RepID=A0A6N2KYD1_SALVM
MLLLNWPFSSTFSNSRLTLSFSSLIQLLRFAKTIG